MPSYSHTMRKSAVAIRPRRVMQQLSTSVTSPRAEEVVGLQVHMRTAGAAVADGAAVNLTPGAVVVTVVAGDEDIRSITKHIRTAGPTEGAK